MKKTLLGLALFVAATPAAARVGEGPAPASDRPVGDYRVIGHGTNDYVGTLRVARDGDGYAFRWLIGGPSNAQGYVGMGVKLGDAVAVVYGSGPNRLDGFGLYRYGSTGLHGYWTTGPDSPLFWESGTRRGGAAPAIPAPTKPLVGRYEVNGERADGARYTSTLEITTDGPGYRLRWTGPGGGDTAAAYAIRLGDDLAALGFAGQRSSLGVYHITANGLDGRWSADVRRGVGRETARRVETPPAVGGR